ncbi:hypothetical protein C7475_104226 [Chitinophaga sp. S165]|nr:hypothetical protein C7475_104226 [Chitinophaga sp. S165]
MNTGDIPTILPVFILKYLHRCPSLFLISLTLKSHARVAIKSTLTLSLYLTSISHNTTLRKIIKR